MLINFFIKLGNPLFNRGLKGVRMRELGLLDGQIGLLDGWKGGELGLLDGKLGLKKIKS